MILERYQIPLSPPNSPRMSDASTKPVDYPHPRVPQHQQSQSIAAFPERQLYAANQDARPSLPSFSNISYSQGSPGLKGFEDANVNSHAIATAAYPARSDLSPITAQTAHIPSTSANGLMSTSPPDRLTSRSPASASRDAVDDDDLLEFGDEDHDNDSDRPPLTAEQIRAQKKKNKRFRLTHVQTRFLMSEFARQAHPDAAHRERLAREIPGLSARQVQVWFQNRRAKLKRLTNDDRERMMRSRALPPDFDTTQALHGPFGAQPSSMGAQISSMGSYQPYGDGRPVQTLHLDTLRRVPDYEDYGQQYGSPTGVSPAMSGFAFTPPQSASEHLSPGSATSNLPSYALQPPGSYDSSGRPPNRLTTSGYMSYGTPSHMQRMPLHERFHRQLGDPAGSPLRSSLSYANLAGTSSQPRSIPNRAASFSEHTYGHQRPSTQHTGSPGASESGPFGLGFSYTQNLSYQHNEQQPRTSIPIDVHSSTDPAQYRRPGQSTAYGQYHSTGLDTQISPYSSYSTPYSNTYHSTYAQQGQVTDAISQTEGQVQPSYQTVPGAAHPYAPLGASHGNQVTDSHGGNTVPSY